MSNFQYYLEAVQNKKSIWKGWYDIKSDKMYILKPSESDHVIAFPSIKKLGWTTKDELGVIAPTAYRIFVDTSLNMAVTVDARPVDPDTLKEHFKYYSVQDILLKVRKHIKKHTKAITAEEAKNKVVLFESFEKLSKFKLDSSWINTFEPEGTELSKMSDAEQDKILHKKMQDKNPAYKKFAIEDYLKKVNPRLKL